MLLLLLLLRLLGSHGAGTLALPGGHLEFGESWSECASREVEEEAGVVLDESAMALLHVTNDPMPDENKHYITLFMCATMPEDAALRNLEPHKCEGWAEYSLEGLEKANEEGKLFGPLKHMVEERPQKFIEWINGP